MVNNIINMKYVNFRNSLSLVVLLFSLSFIYQLISQLTKTQKIEAINLFGFPIILLILIVDFVIYFFSNKNSFYNYWISAVGILLTIVYFTFAYINIP
jgi:hypothetical protein